MKKTILFLCYLVCAVTIFIVVNNVLTPKDGSGIYGMTAYYELERDTVDILFLGSSLSFVNIDPAVLWNDYGYAGYTLGGPVQPLWNTYHYLVEALKTQSPRLVVLEVFCTRDDYLYQEGTYLYGNLLGMKLSWNKIEAVNASTTGEKRINALLGFPYYHSRYSSITKQDILPFRGKKVFEYTLGHGTYYKTVPQEAPIKSAPVEAKPLSEKVLLYLEKITALCKKNNVPLLFIASPTAQYSEQQKVYLSVADFALENGLDFHDFNNDYAAMNLDFSTDFADGNHLNQYGSTKFSSFLGQYLHAHYRIPDWRENPRYDRWISAGKYHNNSMHNYLLENHNNLSQYLSALQKNRDIFSFIFIGEKVMPDSKSLSIMKSMAITMPQDGFQRGAVYLLENGIATEIDASKLPFDFLVSHEKYSLTANGIKKNNNQWYINENEEISIISFDHFTQEVASVAKTVSSSETIVHPMQIVRGWVGFGD